jgi:hypothetical protein
MKGGKPPGEPDNRVWLLQEPFGATDHYRPLSSRVPPGASRGGSEPRGGTRETRTPLKRPPRRSRNWRVLRRSAATPSAQGWVLWVTGRWPTLRRAAGDDARGGSHSAEAAGRALLSGRPRLAPPATSGGPRGERRPGEFRGVRWKPSAGVRSLAGAPAGGAVPQWSRFR